MLIYTHQRLGGKSTSIGKLTSIAQAEFHDRNQKLIETPMGVNIMGCCPRARLQANLLTL
jgi:hypothetical protein